MNCNLRRGLLSTLFAGGLLAFGATAASAADTTSGPDLSASALASAAASVETTSLGLPGGPTQPDTSHVAAVADVNVAAAGDLILSGTTADGTTADANVAAAAAAAGDFNLSRTNSSGTPATETPSTDTTDSGTGAAGDTDTDTTDPGTGTTGDTNTTDPGTGTTGSDTAGITVRPAGTTSGSVSAASNTLVNTAGNTSGQGGTAMLAKTGVDASLIPLALILLLAGLLMLKRRRKA